VPRLEALTDEEIQYALPREMRAPTPAQLAALKAYAAEHGLQWRRKLADAWLIGGSIRSCQNAVPLAAKPAALVRSVPAWSVLPSCRRGGKHGDPPTLAGLLGINRC
jgi:hypothetical protein